MFSTPKISIYLNNFNGQGEKDKAEVRLDCYLTPITYELAAEVSPQLADCLFRRAGDTDEWNPRAEMPKALFQIGDIPAQRVTFYPHKDELVEMYGMLCDNVRISGIQAVRAYQDKLDFRLQFYMNIPKNKTVMDICDRFYKDEIFVSMSEMQPELFDQGQAAPGQIQRCEECKEPAAWEDSDHSFFCQKHVRRGHGEVKLIVKLETPKQAEERAVKEKAAERAAKGEPAPVEDLKDPLVATGEFINKRNARKKKMA